MTRFWLTFGGLVFGLVLFLAVNVISTQTLTSARLDLTEDRLYTLSEGSANLLANLEEDISLQFFYSEKLAQDVPSIKTYATRVKELLQEYVNLSGGRISFRHIDPESFSDDEDEAVAAGIQAVPLNNQGDNFYFGMVASNSVDDREVVPFFQQEREEFLEYDLTRLIYTLSKTGKPKVGVFSPLPVEGGPGNPMLGQQQQPWMIMNQLRELYDVVPLFDDMRDIPQDVETLILIHPAGLEDAALYAIDQFVLRGGRLIAFVDPYSEAAAVLASNPMAGIRVGNNSTLGKLFDQWGIAFDPTIVVGDRLSAMRVSSGGERQRVLDYVAWMRLDDSRFNREDPVIGELKLLNIATAGEIGVKDGGPLTMTPLVTSSPDSMAIAGDNIGVQPDPEKLLASFKADGPKVIAARFNGNVSTAFPDGRPVADDDENSDSEDSTETAPMDHIAQSSKPARLLIISDADMLQDRFWIRVQDFFGQQVGVPLADNGDFLINAVDYMLGSADLIGLRSRGRSARPFTVIEDMRRQAEDTFLAEERVLTERLETATRELEQLQGGSGEAALAGPESDAAIDAIRQEVLATRKQLRDVQLNLNRDIDALEGRIKAVNLIAAPALVLIIAIGIGIWRRKRRQDLVGGQ